LHIDNDTLIDIEDAFQEEVEKRNLTSLLNYFDFRFAININNVSDSDTDSLMYDENNFVEFTDVDLQSIDSILE
jgi:hypothetical protein